MPRRVLLVACLAACAPRSQSEPGVLLIEEKEQTASFIRNFNPLRRGRRFALAGAPLDVRAVVDLQPARWRSTCRGSARRTSGAPTIATCASTLRRGVRWSDGAPFTASDVVFTFGCSTSSTRSTCAASGEFVDGVTAIDDHTVDIALPPRVHPRLLLPGPAADRARAHLEGRRRSGVVGQPAPGRDRPVHRGLVVRDAELRGRAQPVLLAAARAPAGARRSASSRSRATSRRRSR